MTIWVDAQLSPHLAPWIETTFGIELRSTAHLGLVHAGDREIFDAAREAHAIVMTKDVDFVILLEAHGPPPSLLWITCGNTSNDYLRRLLRKTLVEALELIDRGESLVEIADLD